MDSKISNLTELTSIATDDLFVVVDKSDTTQSASGTTKKITKANAVPQITPASSSAPASLDLHEDTDNGTNKITITAPSAIASDKTLTLPDETGTVATKEYSALTYSPQDGWIPADALTYSSADSPTFLATITGDKTGKYSNGMRVRFEQDQALTAYWNLDANSNSQVGSFNGTDTAITYTAGKFGNAATFNGSSSKIVLADNASLKPTGDFTIGFWFKTSNTGAGKVIFSSWSANTALAGVGIQVNNANVIKASIGKNTGTTIETDYQELIGKTVVTDGNWHYVVWSFRNNFSQVYLDGKLEASGYMMTPAYATTNYVRIGCQSSSGTDIAFMNGQIDDLFLINGYALDEKTIKAKYDAQTAQGTGNITIKKYGIITADPTYSNPNTTLTLYCGTDYAMANSAISNPYFSTQKAPFGFPLNPAKWTVEVTNGKQDDNVASPVQNTWYNLGNVNIVVPIGCWKLNYFSEVWALGTLTAVDVYTTLSKANNTQDDAIFIERSFVSGSGAFPVYALGKHSAEKIVNVSSKTTYYLNSKTAVAGVTTLQKDSSSSGVSIIRAVCALL